MNMDKNEITTIKEIIVSFLTDTISEDDKILFESWIKQNPKNRLLFMEMFKTWQFSGTLNKSFEEDSSKMWKRLKYEITNKQDHSTTATIHLLNTWKSKGIKRILAIAASLLFAFFIGRTVGYIYPSNENITLNPQHYQVTTPNGTRSELLLADGTKVWLNAGSTLKYAENYNKSKREVELTGEAFFQVKTDKSKPFTVTSSGLKIQALGTSFNIKAYPEDETLVATLVEGRLIIEGKSRRGSEFKYVLTPKQKLVCIKTAVKEPIITWRKDLAKDITDADKEPVTREISHIRIASNINTELYTSWKDSRWIIEGEKLSNLVIMLERRYNVKILYEPDELNILTFTGTIENETLEQVLHVLQLSAPLKYEFGTGMVRLGIDKNQQRSFHMLMKDNNH